MHNRSEEGAGILFATSDLVAVAALDDSINADATQSASGPAGGERHEPVLSQDLRRITGLRRALDGPPRSTWRVDLPNLCLGRIRMMIHHMMTSRPLQLLLVQIGL